jgi:hypothetical protein
MPLCFERILAIVGRIGILLLIVELCWSISGIKAPIRTNPKKRITLPVGTKGIATKPTKNPKAKCVFASIQQKKKI